jgi:glycosyltransferase involved in cell wall biosynthesis
MIKKYNVFLTGRDCIGWATDDDYKLTQEALAPFCEFVSLKNAEVVHTVNWHELLDLDIEDLRKKYVISHIPHDVRNMLMQPNYLKIASVVDKWIVMSLRAKKIADELNLPADYVPYPVNKIFYKIDKNDPQLKELLERFEIPENVYLIGSFQRDTEGKDLRTPKYMKGPDIFLEMMKRVHKKFREICVILAGPRRFWLIKELEKASIPCVYVGKEQNEDDIRINTLPRETVNLLYNLVDLYVVSSRLEGGPKAIIECAAARCKIISTDVGQARDILSPECIYHDPIEGANKIIRDIEEDFLSNYVEANFKNIEIRTIEFASNHWKNIYNKIAFGKKKNTHLRPIYDRTGHIGKLYNFLFGKNVMTILHTFHKPPWGGGNQFLLALKKAVEQKGWTVNNNLKGNPKLCIFNSFTFDMSLLENREKYRNTRMVHRVDGPTILVRGKDRELDDKVFEINKRVADITVFQSYWSFRETIKLGYTPKNPVIIPNTVDPDIFNRKNRIKFSRKRKIRLISTSWSSNLNKGFETYRWIENHLDWNKFEYTFVGNSPWKFEYINHIPPQPSEKLADILRQHDIYIIASRNDPCSNALIEAQACGLPALYLNDGGHPEIVGYGGLGFSSNEEILSKLDYLVENYETFQNLIAIPRLQDIAEKYLSLIKLN